jgi:hypothetical protein
MNFSIAFEPQLPVWLIAAIAIPSALLIAWGLWQRLRGSLVRMLAWAFFVLALLNPAMLFEDREPLKSIVVVVRDASGSQKLDGRDAQSEAIRQALSERFAMLESFDVREVTAEDQISATTDVSTALFKALSTALADVPPDRVAGAVMITDGQVHDIPQSLAQMGINAPLHALITGRADERDRRVVIEQAPRFGVVGEPYEIDYRVTQTGFPTGSGLVDVTVRLDGEVIATETVVPGEANRFVSEIAHGGRNIIEFSVDADPQEITDVNNRAFVNLNGIRENLRVLLVSGEPHPGERTWRNLLKSDPSVDLVHFTILRPPEKQDGTPINQLSLIAFPTRELFIEKIDEFDLIIFDRYKPRGILPLLYYDNIVRYVREGGALMIAAGPELGDPGSIAEPLAPVMPAFPDGTKREEKFKPSVSELGLKHPVTRDLDGWRKEGEPTWGSWFRTVGSSQVTGNTVMTGKDDAPLLVLSRAEEGRAALFLSDHPWLWARGYEGGGPHLQLLRRTAHWLMKEPELDEERLTIVSDGRRLRIERQTLGDNPGPATLKGPTGEEREVALAAGEPGIFAAELEVADFGLYSASSGDLTALAHVGPPNPREFTEVVSTEELLRPVVEEGRGSVRRASGDAMPRIVPVRQGATASGQNWIGFENTQASLLKGIDRIPLFSGLLGLALLLLALAAMWAREGTRSAASATRPTEG